MRLGRKQFIKATREPIIAFLAKNLKSDDPSMRAKIATFLDTELGEALLEVMLSMGLSTFPASLGDIPSRLARELRVDAMTNVGDVVADLLMGPLRSVITDFLRGSEPLALPAESATLVPVPNLQEVPQEAPQSLFAKK
jgi:hypothetical protein